ncbi:MAG TPA: tetratricopeptide repeat protein [Acidobacteriaceae bacterium]|nr:tetratricopeptide repeat protein [Acidobacteriaceae bacterium]
MNKATSQSFEGNSRLLLAAFAAALTCSAALQAQTSTPAQPAAKSPQTTAGASAEGQIPDKSTAYYHAALADYYEDMATNFGRQDYVTRAVEEYKLALNADPDSPSLATSLAELYFRAGRAKEAIQTTQEIIKKNPDNLAAHKLLGRIYLRSLGQQENGQANSPNGQILDLAIAEFTKIVSLEPKSIEDRLLLGQLYTVKHDTTNAEAQFKAAQDIEPASEEVVLNLARLYAESGDMKRSVELLEAVPVSDRTPKEEFALGGSYEQLKENKKAISAYQRAVDMEPDNLEAVRALGTALLTDGQFSEARKQFQMLSDADPEDVSALDRLAEAERRQGKFSDALATAKKALAKDPTNLEAGYTAGLVLDVMGRYDDAVAAYQKMVDATSHANGAYTQEEKNNRSIFLGQLASVYHEQNKTDEAIATYQKLIDLGGEFAKRGYQGQVDVYRDAHKFDEATAICRKAVAANPKDRDLKLLLAWQLSDTGKLDEGLTIANGLLTGKPNEDKEVYFQISEMQQRQKHWKEADDALAKAEPLATSKDDKVNFYFRKGALAEREKHYEAAEQLFHKVLEIDPNNAITLNNLGYMLADKTSRYSDALKYIRKAVELEPMNGAYLDSLGWVYLKLGQYEQAEDNLRKAVERNSTDPTVHDHLGDLYEKTGRIRLAAAQWEISVAEFAKSASADIEPAEVAKVQKKLEGARVKLAKQDSHLPEEDKQ